MDSFSALIKNESLQDRINRMNAFKEAQKKADEEFIRRQKIRMFINDCDDIRPGLRAQLLIDSKLCQREQIKDKEIQQLRERDFEEAWHEVLSRDYFCKTEKEKEDQIRRQQHGLAVQDYLMSQMYEKKLASAQIYDEINEELEQISISKKKEEAEDAEERKKKKMTRKMLKEEISKQIQKNEDLSEQQRKKDLEFEKMLNKKIEAELRRDENEKKSEREHFRREVFHYLDYLRKTRHQNVMEESEKEKLIEDIRKVKNEHEWIERCELKKKRALVNQQARLIQVNQINEQERVKIEEAAKEKAENLKFNQHEMNERVKLNEEKWKCRVKAHHYGQELLDQVKMEQLRDLAEKQKLEEQLKLAAIEREQREAMGREFVKSYEDVLPLHSNLLIIRKGKATN